MTKQTEEKKSVLSAKELKAMNDAAQKLAEEFTSSDKELVAKRTEQKSAKQSEQVRRSKFNHMYRSRNSVSQAFILDALLFEDKLLIDIAVLAQELETSESRVMHHLKTLNVRHSANVQVSDKLKLACADFKTVNRSCEHSAKLIEQLEKELS